MYKYLKSQRKKVGLPPGSVVYTGEKSDITPTITLISYTHDQIQEKPGKNLEDCLSAKIENGVTWINVDGLQNVDLIKQIGHAYALHPLVLEDIVNPVQRAKIETFDKYIFIVMKMMIWHEETNNFTVQQISLILGDQFVITFQEKHCVLFDTIQNALRTSQGRIREQGSDYLTYILIDTIVDHYFLILENLGDQIETVEQVIITDPTRKNIQSLYKLKRKVFIFRKIVWPVREIINHLLQTKFTFVSDFVLPYYRDVYDHVMQIIDTVETFRDMLGSMLDIYLSSLTNRINEVMKVLTIIATLFIPLTFLASIYGMNFKYMPELNWKWGYFTVLGIMGVTVIGMLVYFRKKKWI